MPSKPLTNKVQNKGDTRVCARGTARAELNPFISIVQHPGRPIILGMEFLEFLADISMEDASETGVTQGAASSDNVFQSCVSRA